MIKLKLRRVSLHGAPWGATLDEFRPEYDGRVLVLELDSSTDLERDATCFNLEIDFTSHNSPCNGDLEKYGWYDAVVERVGYDPNVVHCHFDELLGVWIDYLARKDRHSGCLCDLSRRSRKATLLAYRGSHRPGLCRR